MSEPALPFLGVSLMGFSAAQECFVVQTVSMSGFFGLALLLLGLLGSAALVLVRLFQRGEFSS